jgi:hypothetical protein
MDDASSPLHVACSENDFTKVQRLIEMGATDVNSIDKVGYMQQQQL